MDEDNIPLESLKTPEIQRSFVPSFEDTSMLSNSKSNAFVEDFFMQNYIPDTLDGALKELNLESHKIDEINSQNIKSYYELMESVDKNEDVETLTDAMDTSGISLLEQPSFGTVNFDEWLNSPSPSKLIQTREYEKPVARIPLMAVNPQSLTPSRSLRKQHMLQSPTKMQSPGTPCMRLRKNRQTPLSTRVTPIRLQSYPLRDSPAEREQEHCDETCPHLFRLEKIRDLLAFVQLELKCYVEPYKRQVKELKEELQRRNAEVDELKRQLAANGRMET
ncbi:hypothetical protein SJAG_01502 [Schizosaccharomyces japonicus yFS275]|uniref:Uncharacterized protein n=1 Tax=Schizosaccharomyces japonicus (strain yFS275 / FY16936) TaxID=402676 RepID=B6JY43_SCHJY|nr:hypothetical protein SJAG_01502 [Schizosaccharomyces japonicus yFS275]EEB06461.1 hypothetical protein SJAG_01502 [Schizosaccharomyces japonicus yFS275]